MGLLFGLVLSGAFAFGCGAKREENMQKQARVSVLQVTSSAFTNEGSIPARFTCDGDGISPPLAWSGAPDATESFALVVEDPDAPSGTFVHWVAWNIKSPKLDENVSKEAVLGNGMRQGQNSWSKPGYGGPCPPSGSHRYYFKVFALDRELELPPKSDSAALEKAMSVHVIAQGELMGRYQRKR